MAAIKVKKDHFTAKGNIYNANTTTDLAYIIRQMATFQCRRLIEGVTTNFTDNSGGSAGSTLTVPVLAPDAHTVSSSDALGYSEFNTAAQATKNALRTLITPINAALTVLGLTTVTTTTMGGTDGSGTIASIAAASGVDGSSDSAVDYADYTSTVLLLVKNQATVALALERICVAIGLTPLTNNFAGNTYEYWNLTPAAVPAISSGNDGTADQTVALSDGNAAITIFKNNVASMAAKFTALSGVDLDTITAPVVAFNR